MRIPTPQAHQVAAARVVAIFEEDRLAAVPALRPVMRQVGDRDVRKAGRGRKLAQDRSYCNRYPVDRFFETAPGGQLFDSLLGLCNFRVG
jgi:hypothetical protein